MSDFERVKVGKLLIRDVDMARFFVKYAKENLKYLLKEDEENTGLFNSYEKMGELENDLMVQFDLLKKELNIDLDTVEDRRLKKRKKKKSKKTKRS